MVAVPPLPVPLNPPPLALCTFVALLALAALLAEPTPPWLWGTLLTLVGPRPDPPDLSPGSSRKEIRSLKSLYNYIALELNAGTRIFKKSTYSFKHNFELVHLPGPTTRS